MNKSTTYILTLALIIMYATGFSQSTSIKRCGISEYETFLRSKDPLYDQKKQEFEQQLQNSISQKTKGQTINTFAQYTIPVVVHVVWRTSGENVSDAQVTAMINQLNMDWSRTNPDTANTPAAWQPIAANMQIQFCLATQDPLGNPTTGIVHAQTTLTGFSGDDKIKFTSQGGDDAWDVQQYFNIWIGNFSGIGLLGYASQLPLSNVYGVAIDYKTVGSLSFPSGLDPYFGSGRTLSHEIGHCFTLKHIWGDDGSACSGTDNCTDTPNMAGPTVWPNGCPSGTVTDACGTGADGSPPSNASPGRMYQNFMDYTDDLCYNMFTAGQKSKAQTAIFGSLTVLTSGAATLCGSMGISENELSKKVSIYPNPSAGEVVISSEIPSAGMMDLKVYNAMGETVLSKKIRSSYSKVDLNANPNGVYLFELKTSEGNITKKVIVNR